MTLHEYIQISLTILIVIALVWEGYLVFRSLLEIKTLETRIDDLKASLVERLDRIQDKIDDIRLSVQRGNKDIEDIKEEIEDEGDDDE